MTRVNITLPDELTHRARAQRLNISRLAAGALSEELDRLDRIRALDDYLSELEATLGPVSKQEQEEAVRWVQGVVGESDDAVPATVRPG